MAADLEDSDRYHRERGCEPAEAERLAADLFATSDETLRLLGKLHGSDLAGTADRFSLQIGAWWSKLLLVALLGFEMLLAARVLTEPTFFVHSRPFLWPLAALALALVLITFGKLAQILSHRRLEMRRLRAGLTSPLFLAAASLVVSLLGFLYHLQRFFRLNAQEAPESLLINFAGWMVSISSLMVVGLLTAILGAAVWFVLSELVSRSEAREVESLLRVEL